MRSQLTPWERFEASARLEEVDFVQCYLPLRGASYREGPRVDLVKRYPEAIHFLTPGVQPDPSLFGARMDDRNLGVESDWWEPLIRSEEDYDRLEMPDVRAELMPRLLGDYRRLRARLEKDTIERYGFLAQCSILGPVDFASEMRGYDRLLADLLHCPARVQRLFDLITRVNVEWIKLCQEVLGELRLLWLADHGLTFMSPRLYPSFGLPYWRRELAAASRHAVRCYHNEGDVTGVLEAVPEMGADVFHLGWVPLVEAKSRIGDRVCLCGNLNSTGLLLAGSRSEVAEAAKNAIAVAAPGGGFILSSSGGMAPRTPFENVDAMYKAAKTSGRYPL